MTTRLWGPTRLVNDYTDEDQNSPQVAVLSSGLIVVVWDDLDQGQVMMRLLLPDGTAPRLPDGTPVFPDIPLGAVPLGGFGLPAIAAEICGCGGFVVAYQAVNDELIVRSFDPLGQVTVVHDSAFGAVAAIDVAENGDVLIVTITPTGELVAQLNDASGAVLNTTTLATAEYNASGADVTFLADGSAVVSYQTVFVESGVTYTSVLYQTLDAAGDLLSGVEFVASIDTGDVGALLAPETKVAALEGGGFVIVYAMQDETPATSKLNVHAYVSQAGADQSAQVNSAIAGDQWHADVVAMRDGRFFVAWWSEAGGGTIRGRVYDSSGGTPVPAGQELLIGLAPGGVIDGRGLSVDLTTDGRVVVTWGSQSASLTGDGYDVRTQIVDPRDGYVEGTEFEDWLYGSAFEDQILALDGDDLIFAGAATDEVRGGAGFDLINGEAGDDTIYGDEDDDLIDGGTGADVIYGGEGFDLLSGGAGDDEVYGGTEDDEIDGGTGHDLIDGEDGDDLIWGGVGNDVLVGGWGFDELHGGDGEDELYGDEESDLLQGGAGNDLIDGGSGNDDSDYVSFEDKTVGVTLALDSMAPATAFVNGVAEDTIIDIENVYGGAGNDVFSGDAERNQLNGGEGDDSLDGGVGPDELNGDGGDDVLKGDAGDELVGGDGIDTADFGSATMMVVATLNNGSNVSIGAGVVEISEIENLIGGSAGDRLTGDAGDNALTGGAGNDLLKGGLGADALDGGDGTADTADYREKMQAVVVTLTAASAATVSVGGVAEDTVRNIEFVYGGSAADQLTGDGNANIFRGGAGADVINGGGGVDSVDFRDKTTAVVLTLNGGVDSVATVNGVAEDVIRNVEAIFGGSGNDVLTGDQYNSRLNGGGGADILRGALGADILTGGAGGDTFVFLALTDSLPTASKRDAITDFSGKDGDRIDVSGIDANTQLANDQAFVFGAMAVGQAGRLQLTDLGGFSYRVEGDVNGDGVADFALMVQTTFHVVIEADFVL